MNLNLKIVQDNEVLRELTVESSNFSINRDVIVSKKGYSKSIYTVGCLSKEIKDFCWEFSSRMILGRHQFNRLNPFWANDEDMKNLIRIQRSYVGKLAEVAFLILLTSKNKHVDYHDMFEIYDKQDEVDGYDFITSNKKTIDVKAAFRENHKNLVVNTQQLKNIPKDYYVGVKLNAKDSDRSNKIIDNDSITEAIIYGYAEYEYLNNRQNVNLTEGECKTINLHYLMNINRLLNEF